MPSMLDFPDDPKKIRARIRRYERKLKDEKREHGACMDGAGKRYFLGPLYLLMGDLEGALNSYTWFDEEFPDDTGDPGQYLCWTLALLRGGHEERAVEKLRQTMMTNLYIIPHLLGEEVAELDIWHGSNLASTEYLEWMPREYIALWKDDEIRWASEAYHRSDVTEARDRFIEIHRELRDLPRGDRRSALVDEMMTMRYGHDAS